MVQNLQQTLKKNQNKITKRRRTGALIPSQNQTEMYLCYCTPREGVQAFYLFKTNAAVFLRWFHPSTEQVLLRTLVKSSEDRSRSPWQALRPPSHVKVVA